VKDVAREQQQLGAGIGEPLHDPIEVIELKGLVTDLACKGERACP
jgi:hypothetical protein